MLGFLAPWFLAGLAALGLPVWIHLTEKPHQIVRFPSLMFLQRLPYQAKHRQKIRYWLLLLLRCLALSLLVMAFTHPFLPRGGWLAGRERTGRDVVLLLDRSYSMEYGDRWRRAVAAAKDAIDKLGDHDRGAVVYFGEEPWTARSLTGDKAALREAVDSVRPTASATRYDAAFRAAEQVFGDTAQPRREIVLISDHQRTGWREREPPPLPAGTALTSVNVGDGVTGNIAVTQVDTRYYEEDERELAAVTAVLVNRGPRAFMNHRVALEIGGREVQAKMVDIPADAATEVEFDKVPVPTSTTAGVVRAEADSLPRDNAFHFVLARQTPLPVLLVQPPDAGPVTGLFLTRALAIGDQPAFDIETIRPTQLSSEKLRRAALVVLNDSPIPNDEVGWQLVNYVRGGGGLLVALGPRSMPDQWPAHTDELLPYPTAAPVEPAAPRGETFGFLDWGHPVFEAFTAPHSGNFSAVRFRSYWVVTPGPDDRQLARFGDRHVALLERRIGKGRVLVWSSDLDGSWNNFPLKAVFLPFVRGAATYAAGYKAEWLTATVGQAVTPAMLYGDEVPAAGSAAMRDAASPSTPYVVITPSQQQVRLGVAGSTATLELTEQGSYQVKRANGAVDDRLLAVNVDPVESDLTPLPPGLLEAALTSSGPAVGRTPAASPVTAAAGALRSRDWEQRQNGWWYLLAAAALLLSVETLISNRLSRSGR